MKELPAGRAEIEVSAKPEAHDETLVRLQLRIEVLERELSGANLRHMMAEKRYADLSDIWMVFQATAKPTQRNVHRAEATGEFARRLAEMLIKLAYPAGFDKF